MVNIKTIIVGHSYMGWYNMVTAKSVQGWNMSVSQIFGYTPKLLVVCGKCSHQFYTRTPMVSYPTCVCPSCSELNQLPIEVS